MEPVDFPSQKLHSTASEVAIDVRMSVVVTRGLCRCLFSFGIFNIKLFDGRKAGLNFICRLRSGLLLGFQMMSAPS